MDASKMIRGKTYYRLTFSDPDLTMPGVDPMVFIGKVDTEENNQGEMYCFQDTVSFVRFGCATEYAGPEELGVIFVPETDLGSIYNLEGIANEIQSAQNRAKERGEPMLKQAKGPWT